MPFHADLTDPNDLHIPGVVSTTEPGAIGAWKLWIDIGVDGSPSAPVVKFRNAANAAWINLAASLGAAGGDLAGTYPNPTIKADVGLTGNPTAPTQSVGNNTTRIASTAFVQAAITALINSAPGALDTLDELAAALGDDANFASTVTAALALKAPLASPALTGNPTAPTPSQGDNDTSIATTAFVQAAVASGSGGSGGASTGGYLRSYDGIADPINDNFELGSLDVSGTGNRFAGSTPWTWHNQGSATATPSKSKLRLSIAGSGGHRIIWQPAPSGSWRIRARIGWPVSPTSSTKFGGMILMDSIGGKIESWGWGISPTGIIWAARWTNASTLSATRSTLAHTATFLNPRFWEIEKDGTNYILRYGNDETGMVEFGSFAHTSFLDNVADRIGLSTYADTVAGTPSVIDVEEFYRVA